MSEVFVRVPSKTADTSNASPPKVVIALDQALAESAHGPGGIVTDQ